MSLSDYLGTLALAGTYELSLRARPGQPARTAKVEVRFGPLGMPSPQQKSPYVKQPEARTHSDVGGSRDGGRRSPRRGAD